MSKFLDWLIATSNAKLEKDKATAEHQVAENMAPVQSASQAETNIKATADQVAKATTDYSNNVIIGGAQQTVNALNKAAEIVQQEYIKTANPSWKSPEELRAEEVAKKQLADIILEGNIKAEYDKLQEEHSKQKEEQPESEITWDTVKTAVSDFIKNNQATINYLASAITSSIPNATYGTAAIENTRNAYNAHVAERDRNKQKAQEAQAERELLASAIKDIEAGNRLSDEALYNYLQLLDADSTTDEISYVDYYNAYSKYLDYQEEDYIAEFIDKVNEELGLSEDDTQRFTTADFQTFYERSPEFAADYDAFKNNVSLILGTLSEIETAASDFYIEQDKTLKEAQWQSEHDSIYDYVYNRGDGLTNAQRIAGIADLIIPNKHESAPEYLLKTLTNLGETMDMVAGPTKAILQGAVYQDQTVSENLKRLVNTSGSDYGGTFDWNTGSGILNLGLEVFSDPLDWASIGLSALASIGAKTTIKNVVYDSLRKTIKGLPQDNEGLEKLLKEFSQNPDIIKNIAAQNKMIGKDVEDVLRSTLNAAQTLTDSKFLKTGARYIRRHYDKENVYNLSGVLKTAGIRGADVHKAFMSTLNNEMRDLTLTGTTASLYKMAQIPDKIQLGMLAASTGPLSVGVGAATLFTKYGIQPVKLKVAKHLKGKVSNEVLKDAVLAEGMRIQNSVRRTIRNTLTQQAEIEAFKTRAELPFSKILQLDDTLHTHSLDSSETAYIAKVKTTYYKYAIDKITYLLRSIELAKNNKQHATRLKNLFNFLGVDNKIEAEKLLRSFSKLVDPDTQDIRTRLHAVFVARYGNFFAPDYTRSFWQSPLETDDGTISKKVSEWCKNFFGPDFIYPVWRDTLRPNKNTIPTDVYSSSDILTYDELLTLNVDLSTLYAEGIKQNSDEIIHKLELLLSDSAHTNDANFPKAAIERIVKTLKTTPRLRRTYNNVLYKVASELVRSTADFLKQSNIPFNKLLTLHKSYATPSTELEESIFSEMLTRRYIIASKKIIEFLNKLDAAKISPVYDTVLTDLYNYLGCDIYKNTPDKSYSPYEKIAEALKEFSKVPDKNTEQLRKDIYNYFEKYYNVAKDDNTYAKPQNVSGRFYEKTNMAYKKLKTSAIVNTPIINPDDATTVKKYFTDAIALYTTVFKGTTAEFLKQQSIPFNILLSFYNPNTFFDSSNMLDTYLEKLIFSEILTQQHITASKKIIYLLNKLDTARTPNTYDTALDTLYKYLGCTDIVLRASPYERIIQRLWEFAIIPDENTKQLREYIYSYFVKYHNNTALNDTYFKPQAVSKRSKRFKKATGIDYEKLETPAVIGASTIKPDDIPTVKNYLTDAINTKANNKVSEVQTAPNIDSEKSIYKDKLGFKKRVQGMTLYKATGRKKYLPNTLRDKEFDTEKVTKVVGGYNGLSDMLHGLLKGLPQDNKTLYALTKNYQYYKRFNTIVKNNNVEADVLIDLYKYIQTLNNDPVTKARAYIDLRAMVKGLPEKHDTFEKLFENAILYDNIAKQNNISPDALIDIFRTASSVPHTSKIFTETFQQSVDIDVIKNRISQIDPGAYSNITAKKSNVDEELIEGHLGDILKKLERISTEDAEYNIYYDVIDIQKSIEALKKILGQEDLPEVLSELEVFLDEYANVANAKYTQNQFPEITRDAQKITDGRIKLYHLKLGNTTSTKLFLGLDAFKDTGALEQCFQNLELLEEVLTFVRKNGATDAYIRTIETAIAYTEVAYYQIGMYESIKKCLAFYLDGFVDATGYERAVDTAFDATQNFYNIPVQFVSGYELVSDTATNMGVAQQLQYVLWFYMGFNTKESIKLKNVLAQELKQIYSEYFRKLDAIAQNYQINLNATPSITDLLNSYKRVAEGKQSVLGTLTNTDTGITTIDGNIVSSTGRIHEIQDKLQTYINTNYTLKNDTIDRMNNNLKHNIVVSISGENFKYIIDKDGIAHDVKEFGALNAIEALRRVHPGYEVASISPSLRIIDDTDVTKFDLDGENSFFFAVPADLNVLYDNKAVTTSASLLNAQTKWQKEADALVYKTADGKEKTLVSSKIDEECQKLVRVDHEFILEYADSLFENGEIPPTLKYAKFITGTDAMSRAKRFVLSNKIHRHLMHALNEANDSKLYAKLTEMYKAADVKHGTVFQTNKGLVGIHSTHPRTDYSPIEELLQRSDKTPFEIFIDEHAAADLKNPFRYEYLDISADPYDVLYGEPPRTVSEHIRCLKVMQEMTNSEVFELIEHPELAKVYYAHGLDTQNLQELYKDYKDVLESFVKYAEDIIEKHPEEAEEYFNSIRKLYTVNATQIQQNAVAQIADLEPMLLGAYLTQKTPGYIVIGLPESSPNYNKFIEKQADARLKELGINCAIKDVEGSAQKVVVLYLDNTVSKEVSQKLNQIDLKETFKTTLHFNPSETVIENTKTPIEIIDALLELNKNAYSFEGVPFTLDYADANTVKGTKEMVSKIIGEDVLKEKNLYEGFPEEMPNTFVFGDLEFRKLFAPNTSDDPVVSLFNIVRMSYKQAIAKANFLDAYIDGRISLKHLFEGTSPEDAVRTIRRHQDLIGVYVVPDTKDGFKIKTIDLSKVNSKNYEQYLDLNPAIVNVKEAARLQSVYNNIGKSVNIPLNALHTLRSVYKATILLTPSWVKNNFISTVFKDIASGAMFPTEIPTRMHFMFESISRYTDYRNMYNAIIEFTRKEKTFDPDSSDVVALMTRDTLEKFFAKELNKPFGLSIEEFFEIYEFEKLGPTSIHSSLMKAQEENNIIYGHTLKNSLKHLDDRLAKRYGDIWGGLSKAHQESLKLLQGIEDIAWKNPLAKMVLNPSSAIESLFRYDTFRWAYVKEGNSFSQSIERVKQVHFDYNDTGAWQVIDFILPFANFYMHNTLFYITELSKNPSLARYLTAYLKQTGVYELEPEDFEDENKFWARALLSGGYQLSSGYTFTVNSDFLDAFSTVYNPAEILESTIVGQVVNKVRDYKQSVKEIEEQYLAYKMLLADEGVKNSSEYARMCVDVERWYRDSLQSQKDYIWADLKSYIPVVGAYCKRAGLVYNNLKDLDETYYEDTTEFVIDFFAAFLPDFIRGYKPYYYNYDNRVYTEEDYQTYLDTAEYILPSLDGKKTYYTTRRGVYYKQLSEGASEGPSTKPDVHYTVQYTNEKGEKVSYRTSDIIKALDTLNQGGIPLNDAAKKLFSEYDVLSPTMTEYLDIAKHRYRYSYANDETGTVYCAVGQDSFKNQIATDTTNTLVPVNGLARLAYTETIAKKDAPEFINYYDTKYMNIRISYAYKDEEYTNVYKNIFDTDPESETYGQVIDSEAFNWVILQLANGGICANDLTRRIYESDLVQMLKDNSSEFSKYTNECGIYVVQGYDGSYKRLFKQGDEDAAISALMMNGTPKNEITEELLVRVNELLGDPEKLDAFDTAQGLYRIKHPYYGTPIVTSNPDTALRLMTTSGFIPVTSLARDLYTTAPVTTAVAQTQDVPRRKPNTYNPQAGQVMPPVVQPKTYNGRVYPVNTQHTQAYYAATNGYVPKNKASSVYTPTRPTRYRRARAKRLYNTQIKYRMR